MSAAGKPCANTAFLACEILSAVFIWVDRAGTGCCTSTYSSTLWIRVVLWGYFGVPAVAPLCDATTLSWNEGDIGASCSDSQTNDPLCSQYQRRFFFVFFLKERKKEKGFIHAAVAVCLLSMKPTPPGAVSGCYNRFACTLNHAVLCLAYIYPQVLLFIAWFVCSAEIGEKKNLAFDWKVISLKPRLERLEDGAGV